MMTNSQMATCSASLLPLTKNVVSIGFNCGITDHEWSTISMSAPIAERIAQYSAKLKESTEKKYRERIDSYKAEAGEPDKITLPKMIQFLEAKIKAKTEPSTIKALKFAFSWYFKHVQTEEGDLTEREEFKEVLFKALNSPLQAIDRQTYEKSKQLLKIESEVNQAWEDAHVYELDAPPAGEEKEKFIVTFPYPYMNGRLHLGHLFSFSKAEFAARYQRMKGKMALFPFGFHCTGMPIKASADKLEMEIANASEIVATNLKHSKLQTKVEQGVSQADILRHMEVPDEEIAEFVNPLKWLEYFPPYGKKDLSAYGSCIDWRRSFITTEVNQYYDKFVRWQFNILKQKGLVVFGKRPTICSIKDQQPCMDHDRATGEGVQPQEYTLIKLTLAKPTEVDERFKEYDGVKVVLLAATLRPETMVGQTNYWFKPGVEYEVGWAKGKKELYVCGSRSFRNLAAQDLTESFEPLFQMKSDSLLGAEVSHPCITQLIRGLPLPDIKMTKGTGIVTSVPSDAPADYQGIIDLQKIPEMRAKYGVKEEWVQIEPIRILKTEKYGDFAAKTVLDELKKSSMKREEKLEEAKQLCYKEGFYHGVMIVGPFAGEKVITAKDKMRQLMVNEGSAIVYYEPENEVISRSGDECVVMLCDQWYIEYGQEEWKKKVVEHFNAHCECFHDETREKFRATFEWLGPWACSRQFGLGTRLPFDEKYLIDSLSDSTIYTAYYTIAHLLQSNLDGSKPGLGGLTPDQINDDFFNYVFLNGPLPAGADKAVLDRFRREFDFWYPINVRVSGKDLVTNHLTMYLYNHAAIFPPDKWPIGIRANGHLKLDNEKMSKSTGNFLTAAESMERMSASGVRIGLADSGDAADDANFNCTVVKSAIARLLSFIEFVQKRPESTHEGIVGFADELLDARISRAIKNADAAYDKMMFKLALKNAFYELSNFWTEYTAMTGTGSISSTLRQRYIDSFLLLMTPIIPQFCDHVWQKILGHTSTIVNEKFPTPNPYNPDLFFRDRLMNKTADTVKFRIRAMRKVKGINTATVFVNSQFNEIQQKVLEVLRKHYNEETCGFNDKELDQAVNTDEYFVALKKSGKNGAQKYMPFLQFMRQAVPEFGSFLLNEVPEIDQKKFFQENEQWFLRQLPGVTSIFFVDVATEGKADVPADLWDDNFAAQSQVYIPTATLCVRQ